MEELKKSVQSWSAAKERMEVEIARKKEAYRRGTDFRAARGFVRRNWKTKNYNPEENPLGELVSTDEEDYGQEAEEESPQKEAAQESEKKSEELSNYYGGYGGYGGYGEPDKASESHRSNTDIISQASKLSKLKGVSRNDRSVIVERKAATLHDMTAD